MGSASVENDFAWLHDPLRSGPARPGGKTVPGLCTGHSDPAPSKRAGTRRTCSSPTSRPRHCQRISVGEAAPCHFLESFKRFFAASINYRQCFRPQSRAPLLHHLLCSPMAGAWTELTLELCFC